MKHNILYVRRCFIIHLNCLCVFTDWSFSDVQQCWKQFIHWLSRPSSGWRHCCRGLWMECRDIFTLWIITFLNLQFLFVFYFYLTDLNDNCNLNQKYIDGGNLRLGDFTQLCVFRRHCKPNNQSIFLVKKLWQQLCCCGSLALCSCAELCWVFPFR